MVDVLLTDLKKMGSIGGYTIRLVRSFPFSYTNGILREDGIEFSRQGVVAGRKQEVSLKEPYSRELIESINTIMHNKVLVARRVQDKLVLTGKGYRRVE